MTETQTYDIISATVWAVLLASGPVLGVALAIGLVIAFFQALTQIQEMTLTFVPNDDLCHPAGGDAVYVCHAEEPVGYSL